MRLDILKFNYKNMKKSIAFFCFVLAFTFTANAQRIGVKAGLNIADQQFANGNYKINSESILGFHAGIIGEVPLSKSFFLNSGIFYTEKGCSEKFVAPTSIPDVVNDVERTKRYGYLEIPLNLALKIDAGSVKPYVQAGTYVSYVIYDKISSETNIIDEIKDFDFDTKKMDFGINVGAGIEISSLQLGVNYEWGVVNLADINKEYHIQGEDFSAKNGVLSVSAAILF